MPKWPLYKVQKEKIILIEFEDGEIEVIKQSKATPSILEADRVFNKRNILTLNAAALTFASISIGYENISESGKFGFKGSLTASLAPYEVVAMYVIGGDFNFYNRGQKRFTYFFGPAFRTGFFDDAFISVLFNNGVAYNAKSGFYLSTQLGLGPSYYETDGLLAYGYWKLNIGGRF